MQIARTPIETQPGRMQALARLPVFFALEGKRVLLAGGSAQAAWKAELMSAAGARVEVYAHELCDELRGLIADPPRGAIVHARQRLGAGRFRRRSRCRWCVRRR